MAALPPVPGRSETIAAFRAQGGEIAAVYPIYYPRSIFRAHGLLPVEVWGPPGVDPTPAAAHVQAYACSIVRSGLAFLLSGGLGVASVICVPHSCDSLQGLGSLLIDFVKPTVPVVTWYLPRAPGSAAVQFLAAENRTLSDRLARVTGKTLSAEILLARVLREEQADALLGELLHARRRLPGTNREFYALVRSREYLPAERFIELAEQALTLQGEPRGGVPVLLSGIVPEPMSVLDALDEAGALVVADDLACCGRRVYPPGTSGDPFERIAERMVAGPLDPMRGSNIAARNEQVLSLARDRGARAALFYEIKFCEPELFYLPPIRKALDAAGIPSIVVEGEVSDAPSQQALTRIEALLETVADGEGAPA